MIEAISVTNFRGFAQLDVAGFKRVNLIVGKNNAGKTALMEAVAVGQGNVSAAPALLGVQQGRFRDHNVPVHDFDRFWSTLFHGKNCDTGIKLSVVDSQNGSWQIDVSRENEMNQVTQLDGDGSPDSSHVPWKPGIQFHDSTLIQKSFVFVDRKNVKFDGTHMSREHSWTWIYPYRDPDASELRMFTQLRMSGSDHVLLSMLREIDNNITGVELLAPSGEQAEFFFRTLQSSLLPLAMTGDGFQRCFEIGLCLSSSDSPLLFIDEIDNGLHYTVLESLWRWVGSISAKRQVQVFVTTHSDECIRAACRAFKGEFKDDFRVIRLDREGETSRATVYDSSLVEAAMKMDVEIRG